MLDEQFYMTDSIELARNLLGKLLIHKLEQGDLVCRITETEAYTGILDKASHAFGGRKTERTSVMYLPGGYTYIYLIYGMYNCLNIVAGSEGDPEAVLIRGAVPVAGLDGQRLDGPGKLCRAMKIDRTLNALSLTGSSPELYIEDDGFKDFKISSGPRVNIDYAEDYIDKPWRFFISR